MSRLINLTCLIILLAVVFLGITGCETTKPAPAKPEMEGTWIGLGKVIIPNEYLNQRQLAFMLIIEKNGTLTGYAGDATIAKTKLQKPVWWLGLVGIKKYTATFKLGGSLVNRESFSRDGGTLTFEGFEDGEMICSFKSTGNQVSTSNLALEVRDIRLNHPRQ